MQRAKNMARMQTIVQNGIVRRVTVTLRHKFIMATIQNIAYHRTLPYRIGFAAGVANKVGVCDQFSGRDATICFYGQTNGFNRNIQVWEQTARI
jgi:hypothetical protein